MPTPLLTASTRFTDQATTVIYIIPSIAATNLTPTRAEMTAGLNITGEVNDLSGWTVESNQIVTEDLASPFESTIPGSTTAPKSDLVLYTSKNGVDIRNSLPRNTVTNIMFCDGGDTGGNKAEVYPVIVTSNGVMRNVPGKTASKVKIMFAITKQPAQGVTVPA